MRDKETILKDIELETEVGDTDRFLVELLADIRDELVSIRVYLHGLNEAALKIYRKLS